MQDIFAPTSFGRIHALAAGEGPTLILLHSNGGSAYEFEHVIEPLAERFRVFAWDMPGQGDSDPLPRHISVDDYADAVVEFMDALGIGEASILGASIGGAICVSLGARHAGRVQRLFIVECPFRSPEEWQQIWPRTEAGYAPITQSEERVRPRLRALTPELLTRWNIDRSKAGTKTCLSVMWALRDYDIAANLPRLPPEPVLIFGDRSPTVGKLDRFRDVLTTASTHVISDCGHFPMIDDPDAFTAIVSQEMDAR